MYLSYSGWKTFKGCPAQYSHKYVQKTVLARPENRINSIYGSVVGLVFEAFYAQGIWRRSGVEELLLSMCEPMLDQAIERESKGGVIDFKDPAANYKTRPGLLKAIRDSVPRGIASIRQHRLLGMDAAAEVKLDSDIEGHRIGGRADFAMTRIKPDSDLVIIDGKGSRHREKYVDPTQLKWYAMLWRERFHTLPSKLAFLFWRYDPTESLDWVPFTVGELDDLKNTIVETAGQIQRGQAAVEAAVGSEKALALAQWFPTHPSSECKLCAFLDLCEPGKNSQKTYAPPPPGFFGDGVDDISL